MRLTDGERIADIKMVIWNGSGYDPDWSNDFFEQGSLPYCESLEAYVVPDVQYCIDQANDWKQSKGDFSEDEPNENNEVIVDEEDCDYNDYVVALEQDAEPETEEEWTNIIYDDDDFLPDVAVKKILKMLTEDGFVK